MLRRLSLAMLFLVLAGSYRSTAQTIINFDDAPTPASFSATLPLTNRYYDAGTFTGVQFQGVGTAGMGIVSASAFAVTGGTGPNVLAWDTTATYSNASVPAGPEVISFSPPVTSICVKSASPAGLGAGEVLAIRLFDSFGTMFREFTINLGSEYTTVCLTEDEIASVRLITPAQVLVVDQIVYLRDPPANDECALVTPVGPGAYFGATSNATHDIDVNCGATSTGPDVWYRFLATSTGTVNIHTAGSSYNTFLSVHGDCSGAPLLACNDDAGGINTTGSLASEVNLPVTQGVEYLIRVGGTGPDSGRYRLSISEVDGVPNSACAMTRQFPSTKSESIGVGGIDIPFKSSTDTVDFWSAASGHKISQQFFVADRPIVFEAVLNLYVINGLNPGNQVDFAVKVNGTQVGTFTVNADDPDGRRELFYSFSGLFIDVNVELAVTNEVSEGGGSVSFGYAGNKASFIELHGRASAEFNAADAGWYNSDGNHTATNNNALTGFAFDSPTIANYNSFYVFNTAAVRGARYGRLSLSVTSYLSPDPFEVFEVYSFEGDVNALQLDQAGAVAIHNDLQNGELLGAGIIRSTDLGKIITIELDSAIVPFLASPSGVTAVGVHLASRDHADNAAISEGIIFGNGFGAETRRLEVSFCDAPAPGDIYGVSEMGSILKFDPVEGRVHFMSPLGDGTTELQYDPNGDRLLAFEPGLQELRAVDLLSFIQTSSSNLNHLFLGYTHVLSRFYGATSDFGPNTQIYFFDGSGGGVQPTGIAPIPAVIGALAFDREAGRMLGLEQGGSGRLYSIDTFHEQTTLVADTSLAASALVFDSAGELYAGGAGPGAGVIYTINKQTGVSIPAATHPFGGIAGMTQVRPPAINRRPVGDFNADYCTGIGDFLILLDNWQLTFAPLGAPIIGLEDFLNLLDNWQTGPGC